MNAPEIRGRIKQWELLRLPFNAACVIGAWLAWRLVGDVPWHIREEDRRYSLREMNPGVRFD